MKLLLSLLLVFVGVKQAEAQVEKDEIVVLFWHDSPNDGKALVGLKRGLHALGLVDRLRVINLDQNDERSKATLAACESAPAALVIALGTEAARRAKAGLKTVPMVFSAVTNPLLSGIVATWEGSGELVAGNSNWLDRRTMLQVFRRALPDLRRLLILTSKGNAVSEAEFLEASEAAEEDGAIKLDRLIVESPDALETLLGAHLDKADALWIPIDLALYRAGTLERIVELAARRGVPIVSSSQRCAGRGAMVVVTVDYEALGLQAASLVKSIVIEKRDPGLLPVGRIRSPRLYVDLDAARRLKRRIPLDLILEAWKVFDSKHRRGSAGS